MLALALAGALALVIARALAAGLGRVPLRADPRELEVGGFGAAEPGLGEAGAADRDVREVDRRGAHCLTDLAVELEHIVGAVDDGRDLLLEGVDRGIG